MLIKQSITKLWIDESGDCGFKFDRGSSRFLVIACAYLIELDKECYVKEEANRLKSKLHLTKDYEFKFSRCKDKFRREIFNFITKLPIKYKAVIVDKKKLLISDLRFQPQQIYCELIRRLLYDNEPPLEKAILIIDEATAKIHHKEFNQILKKYLSKNIVSKIRQKRSRGEIMIQIADLIAGAIFRKHEKQDAQYYQLIKDKEKIIIEF